MKETKGEATPLHFGNDVTKFVLFIMLMLFKKAALNGHVNLVETLIKLGANVDSINIDGCSPLHFGNNLNNFILFNNII